MVVTLPPNNGSATIVTNLNAQELKEQLQQQQNGGEGTNGTHQNGTNGTHAATNGKTHQNGTNGTQTNGTNGSVHDVNAYVMDAVHDEQQLQALHEYALDYAHSIGMEKFEDMKITFIVLTLNTKSA